jgi:hypothetical protein
VELYYSVRISRATLVLEQFIISVYSSYIFNSTDNLCSRSVGSGGSRSLVIIHKDSRH